MYKSYWSYIYQILFLKMLNEEKKTKFFMLAFCISEISPLSWAATGIMGIFILFVLCPCDIEEWTQSKTLNDVFLIFDSMIFLNYLWFFYSKKNTLFASLILKYNMYILIWHVLMYPIESMDTFILVCF